MRLIVDEDLSPRVASIGRGLRLDIVHVHELHRGGLDDDQQLLLAAGDGRCIVTKNGADFVTFTHQFQELHLPHAGVLVISQSLDRRDFAGIARALAAYVEGHPGDMPPYMVDWIHPVPDEG